MNEPNQIWQQFCCTCCLSKLRRWNNSWLLLCKNLPLVSFLTQVNRKYIYNLFNMCNCVSFPPFHDFFFILFWTTLTEVVQHRIKSDACNKSCPCPDARQTCPLQPIVLGIFIASFLGKVNEQIILQYNCLHRHAHPHPCLEKMISRLRHCGSIQNGACWLIRLNRLQLLFIFFYCSPTCCVQNHSFFICCTVRLLWKTIPKLKLPMNGKVKKKRTNKKKNAPQ